MKTRRNTATVPTDAEAKRRLQKLIDRLPLPPGANATVISARVRPYEYSGDYHDEEGHALEYEVGGHTDLDADSALARYRDHDLHRIVSDALGVRRGDEEALLEDTDVLRDSRTLRDYPGFSVIWSGTLLDRSTIHTDDGDKRADAVSEVRAGKRNAGFMQKLLADVKTNPRRSERGGPKRGYLETRRPLSKVPLTSSVFDKENWFVGYANERAKSGVPFMDRAFLHLHAGNWTGREEQGTVYLDVPLAWDKPIPTRIGTFHAANITSVSFYYTPRTNSLLVTYDLDFDAERNHSALRAVVYGPQPRTLRRGTRIIEEHPRGPRGLEEAVRMARKDFEGRMVDGTIKVGTPRYGLTETPKVLLSAEETRELLAARQEAMRADDEGYDFVHKLPKHIKELLIIMRPDLNGDFGPVYRADVDAILAWYRSLPRQNPRARRVSTAVLGERVRVFRNLHTETWSVESATTGRIIAHPDTVLLEDVRLVSRDAGREKVRRTGKKNVHAIATGTLVAIDGPAPADLTRWTPLYYNPFKVDTFVEFVGGKVGKPVRGARMWFAAADHRSQYALAPQEADPGRYKKPKAPRRENGLLASLALVGIGMAAGVYVEEQKGVAARVRRALKGKDKVAREQFDHLKRGVLAAKPRVPLAIRTSTPITVRSSIVEAVTDPAWVREESPDGKGYIHARTMKGTPYEVFERVYGKGNKLVVLDVGEAHERVNAPNGKDGWPSVAAAKRAAEALAGMRLASA